MCAGLIAAENNTECTIGIAFKATITGMYDMYGMYYLTLQFKIYPHNFQTRIVR